MLELFEGGLIGAIVGGVAMKLVIDNLAEPVDKHLIDPLTQEIMERLEQTAFWDALDNALANQINFIDAVQMAYGKALEGNEFGRLVDEVRRLFDPERYTQKLADWKDDQKQQP